MTVVDAHHHLYDPARRAYPWLDPPPMDPIRRAYGLDDLRVHTAAAGVERTVLVQTLPDVVETRELLDIASGSGGLVAGVVGWVDLADPDVPETLDELRAGPGGEHLVGIRHQVQDEPDFGWLLRPEVLSGLRAVAATGLAYDLLVLPGQLPTAIAAVEHVGEGRFVLDHAGKPPIRSGDLHPWADDLRRLAALPNVTCKLSGLVTEADWEHWTTASLRPYVDVMFEAFGPRRVMAGSDWPVCELAATYERVWGTATSLLGGLTTGEQDGVLGGVAERVYRLA